MAECRRRFPNEQLVVLWLGSSVGNLKPPEAVQFFRDMTAGGGDHIQVWQHLAEWSASGASCDCNRQSRGVVFRNQQQPHD